MGKLYIVMFALTPTGLVNHHQFFRSQDDVWRSRYHIVDKGSLIQCCFVFVFHGKYMSTLCRRGTCFHSELSRVILSIDNHSILNYLGSVHR